MSPLLIPEPPLQVLPSLAVAIGLNEAIVLQQIHYWAERSTTVIDGHRWVYNTVAQWRVQFPFWSDDTISRTIKSLRERGIVIARHLSENAFDRTLYYRVDYPKMDELQPQKADPIPAGCGVLAPAVCGNGGRQDAGLSDKTETTSENTQRAGARRSAPRAKGDTKPATIKADQLAQLGVPAASAEAWLAIRKEKRLPLTQRALELTEQDGREVGMTLLQTIEACIRRGWAAFRVDWWRQGAAAQGGANNSRDASRRRFIEGINGTGSHGQHTIDLDPDSVTILRD